MIPWSCARHGDSSSHSPCPLRVVKSEHPWQPRAGGLSSSPPGAGSWIRDRLERAAGPASLDSALRAALRDEGRAASQKNLAAKVGLRSACDHVGAHSGAGQQRLDQADTRSYRLRATSVLAVHPAAGKRHRRAAWRAERETLGFPEIAEVAWITGDDVVARRWAKDTNLKAVVASTGEEVGAPSRTTLVLVDRNVKPGIASEAPATTLE